MLGLSSMSAAARRRIVILWSAAATFALADWVVRGGDESLRAYYTNQYTRKRAVIDSLPQRPDIVLFGSSRTHYGLVPDEFARATARRVFNFGVPASKVIEWKIIARETFASWQPLLVVLGVNGSAIRADYLPVPAARDMFEWRDFIDYCRTDGWSSEVAGHYFRHNLGRAWATWHHRSEIRYWIDEHSGFFLPKYAQHARERREMVAMPCPPDGYEHPWLRGERLASLKAQIELNGEGRVTRSGVPAYAPDAQALVHFEELLAWFDAQQIPLVVAYLPNSPRTEARWASVEPQLERDIAAACARAGVPYLSCTRDEIPRSNDDYLDETHAGLYLAQSISRRIAGKIVALGLIDAERPRFADASDAEATVP
jgi:hypothetical protein